MRRSGSEFALIERFVRHFPRRGRGLVAGPGDDCALLRPSPGRELCITTDTIREGVHFGPRFTPADIGHKALAVNLSDLAAMGARPRWFLAAIELPKRVAPGFVDGLGRGMAALARQQHCLLAGGNLCRGPGVAVTLTAIGEVPTGGAIRRTGCGPVICSSLPVPWGWPRSACGFCRPAGAIDPSPPSGPSSDLGHAWRRGWRREASRPRGSTSPTASSQDLAHLCEASGCGAELWTERLPVAPAVAAQRDWLSLCLAGGEDYELLLGVRPQDLTRLSRRLERSRTPAVVIGQASRRPGLRLASGSGWS